MSKLIAIDDGHGRETLGKRTPVFDDGSIMKENEFNEATAFFLQAELQRCGFDTLLVSSEDADIPLRIRVERANKAKADLYISIHANAAGDEWNELAQGIETLVYFGENPDKNTYKLAQLIHKEVIKATGRKNRGIKQRDDLYVLKNTLMSAVLIECGFMTNHNEAALLKNDEYRKKCAKGICKGICLYYKMLYIE